VIFQASVPLEILAYCKKKLIPDIRMTGKR